MSESESTTKPGEEAAETSEDKGLVVTLAGRSEEALRRVYRELSENPRMAEARERLEKVETSVLTSLHIASTEDVGALRQELERLAARVAELERAAGIEPPSAPADDGPGEAPAGG